MMQEPLFSPEGQHSAFVEVAPSLVCGRCNCSSQAPVAVDISLRRGRIALFTAISVVSIVAFVQFLQSGYQVRVYDKANLDATQQKRLLDEYNSYSGNIVSTFSKPIELFAAACVQVILLRFVSASLLRNEPSWKAVYGALVLSAAVSYLINNGFNALNAQLVDLEITSVVDASDLSLDDWAIARSYDWTDHVSNVSWSVSENRTRNPITNTVLRNLVQARALRNKSACIASGMLSFYKVVPLDTVDFGFPQRDWMKQLLTEALPPKTMTFFLNATNQTANDHLRSKDLPMSASIASNLVLYAVRLSPNFTPFRGSLLDPLRNETSPKLTHNIPAAVRVGILPPDQSASEDDQKKWFLKNAITYLTRAFTDANFTVFDTEDMTMNDIPVTFSHVDIAPQIAFDAVTFDAEVDPKLIVDATDQKTGARYVNNGEDKPSFETHSLSCDPWPARCVLKKRDPPVDAVSVTSSTLYYDAPAQIQAFSMCLNANGTETMEAGVSKSGVISESHYLSMNPCVQPSTTSMLLLSVGKRLVADALTGNTTADKMGVHSGGSGSATNVRKIYSFTIGRLSWKFSDVAKDFGATCNISGSDQCQGLVLPLDQRSQTSSMQRLVVGANALPMAALFPPELNNIIVNVANRQRPHTLVQVNEPTRQLSSRSVPPDDDWYDVVAGDILLPHNVRNVTWNQSVVTPGPMCIVNEERIQRVLDNHFYIEHPLQATYTAAMFFLMQNAVVKDVIPDDQSSLSTSPPKLAFNGNTQKVALFLSTPSTNALLTQLGCLFLAVGVAASIAWATIVRNSTSRPNLLTGITNAEVMARAKLDERTFPPLFLHRHVTKSSDPAGERHTLDDLVIRSLSLEPPVSDHVTTAEGRLDRTTKDTEDRSSVRLSVH